MCVFSNTAQGFNDCLLKNTTQAREIQIAFPHAKIVFVATPPSEAKAEYWIKMKQCFDRDYKETARMRDGLLQTYAYVDSLVTREINIVGAKNVVLWGFNRGCAAALYSLLIWNTVPFGAVVGVCGWFPFAEQAQEIEKGNSQDPDGPQAFVTSLDIINHFRNDINLPNTWQPAIQKVPIFFGYGVQDGEPMRKLAHEAIVTLRLLEANYESKAYNGTEELYLKRMMEDMFLFIKEKLKI
ncbi:hypothetical protein NHQ30_001322 [Ciborinia camelliae]|nr:hypothetical protein NHQ30_001322 [Ciborinia camelliae]